ncbi:hypothetical protein ACOMHN_051748 [Nucella lapillus]
MLECHLLAEDYVEVVHGQSLGPCQCCLWRDRDCGSWLYVCVCVCLSLHILSVLTSAIPLSFLAASVQEKITAACGIRS